MSQPRPGAPGSSREWWGAGLMALARVTTLRRVELTGCVSVTDVGVLLLTQLPHLEHLGVAWCLKLSNAGARTPCACWGGGEGATPLVCSAGARHGAPLRHRPVLVCS